MKNILEQIVETKKAEVLELKKRVSEVSLRQQPFFSRTTLSLKQRLQAEDSSGIIAEFKQKSPSKGEINPAAKVGEITRGYTEAGAAGLSVLTDTQYFGGSLDNLLKARGVNPATPILRKDFIIDEIQLVEAKAFGADVVLLIAACLEKEEVHHLAEKAKTLGLEVLLEIHDESELDKISPLVDLVGVNNRNLKTFEVNIETSLRLAPLIPEQFLKISESGLANAETVLRLKSAGFRGFLIGETFMKTSDPVQACAGFIQSLQK